MELSSQVSCLTEAYPTLTYNPAEEVIEGKLIISESDYYNLRIEPKPFPKAFPSVFETSERIPIKADRHVYTDTKSLCFAPRAKAEILIKTRVKNLVEFVELILIPYLKNNSFYEINGHYLTEEYSHGEQGVLEFYQELLDIQPKNAILGTIAKRIEKKLTSLRQPCYCGSGNRIKNCRNGQHRIGFLEFKLISSDQLKLDFNTLYDKKSWTLDPKKIISDGFPKAKNPISTWPSALDYIKRMKNYRLRPHSELIK